MKKLLALALLLLSLPLAALAQSNPGFVNGQPSPTAGQWNSYFSGKVDYLPGQNNAVPYWDGTGHLRSAPASGDCTTVASIFTCTKLGGVSPGTFFPLNYGSGFTLAGSTLSVTNAANNLVGPGAWTTGNLLQAGTYPNVVDSGHSFANPGPIGTTPSTGAFTTLSATGQITSTLATGTAPFSLASTTVVPNLNVSQLLGQTWTSPTITTPTISGHFTAEGVTTTGAQGTGALVFSNSPTLTTPVIGAATGTSLNVSGALQGVTHVLKGSSSGTLTLQSPAAAGSNTVTLPAGTTDFSATGGTSQVVKQTSAGGAFTVARLACADLSDSTAACSVALPLTVANGGLGIASGTSGGVPYYSGSTTVASSGALSASNPVIGGGAGVAPSSGARSGNTTTFGTTSGSLTSGNCIKSDASGNLVDAATTCGGTSVLTKLVTLTASSSATLQDTTHITGTYNVYKIVLSQLVPATNNVQFEIQFTTDNGSTWISANYNANTTGATYIGVTDFLRGIALASGSVPEATILNTVNLGGVSGELTLTNPNGTAGGCSVVGMIYFGNATANSRAGAVSGSNTTTSVVNGIRFLYSSGNIASGTITIYGVTT